MSGGAGPRVDLYLAPTRTWDDAALAAFAASLDPAEQARAARFGHAGARLDFIVAHGLVRLALSRARPDVAPAAWRLRTGPAGKPVAEGAGAPAFSLAHAGGRAVVAVGGAHPLGVDAEPQDAGAAGERTAAVFCTGTELSALRRLDPAVRVEAFFTLWTLKESLVKAAGLGMGMARQAVCCRLDPLGVERCDLGLAGPWQSWTARDAEGLRVALSLAGALAAARVAAHRVRSPADLTPGRPPVAWPVQMVPVPHAPRTPA